MAASGHVIVAGPWLGEVGFELLYWVPFLSWFADRYAVDRARLVAVSRGGSQPWYRHIAGSYHDVFDCVSTEEFRRGNEARVVELGEQKQVAPTAFDRTVLAAVTDRLGRQPVELLHPSTMYALFRHYWWGHVAEPWIHRHTKYRRLLDDVAEPVLAELPVEYTAVKFYFNECFPETEAIRAVVRRVLDRLRIQGPVVSLSTGLRLDNHEEWQGSVSLPRSLAHAFTPRNNLALQTAIVSRAKTFVGTYGGFAYLAPFYGVPSTGVYADAGGFSPRHLRMMQSVAQAPEFGTLRLVNALEETGDAVGAAPAHA